MRFISFYIFLAVVAVIAAIPANLKDEAQSLFDVDVQGHENIGDRDARGQGNYRGGYGGNRGGYGVYSSGGHRGGYGGYGGNRGGYYY